MVWLYYEERRFKSSKNVNGIECGRNMWLKMIECDMRTAGMYVNDMRFSRTKVANYK